MVRVNGQLEGGIFYGCVKSILAVLGCVMDLELEKGLLQSRKKYFQVFERIFKKVRYVTWAFTSLWLYLSTCPSVCLPIYLLPICLNNSG